MSVCNYEPFWIITWYFSMHYWFAKSSKYIFTQHLRRFPYIGCELCTHWCVCGYYKYLLHRRAGISELAYVYIYELVNTNNEIWGKPFIFNDHAFWSCFVAKYCHQIDQYTLHEAKRTCMLSCYNERIWYKV